MRCKQCPFHMTCHRGRLGEPYGLQLCPNCAELCFVVEQRLPDLSDYAPRGTALIEGREEIDDDSLLVTVKGKRVLRQPTGGKIAHVFCFKCEKRPLIGAYEVLYATRRQQYHESVVRHGGKADSEEIVVQVEDPGPSASRLFQIRLCMHCRGWWGIAANYTEVRLHRLDRGDTVPKL